MNDDTKAWEAEKAQAIEVAEEFVLHMVDGSFIQAHGLLSRKLRTEYSPLDLHTRYSEILKRMKSGIYEVMGMCNSSRNFPGYKKNDLAWVYVHIDGRTCFEAVLVVVTREAGQLVIRELEWGAP